MGKKTLYVHIGMAKTGTSALQNFLWINRELLAKKGYCYPSMRVAYSNFSTAPEQRNGHFLVNDQLSDDPKKQREMDEKVYRTGMDEVARLFGTYDNIVLSSESIWASTYEQRASLWEELKADGEKYGFQVKIIVYLRRQDQYLMSFYKQKVKQFYNADSCQTWEEYTENLDKKRQLNYFEKLGRISDVLGVDAMIVCRYDRSGFYGGDIYTDFMHRIGLEYTDEYVIKRQEQNISLSGNAVEMKRMINAVKGLNHDDNIMLKNILLKVSEASSDMAHTELFSRSEAEEFLSKFEDSNEKVAQMYFGDGKPLFGPVTEDMPKYDRDNPYMLEDIVRFTALGIRQMRRENEKLKKQVTQCRAEIDSMRDKLLHPLRTVASKIRKS